MKESSPVMVIIWDETGGILLHHDCIVNISEVAETLKPTLERNYKIIEISRLVGVTVWGKTDGLLLHLDCFIKISKVTKTFKPTLESVSEVIEI